MPGRYGRGHGPRRQERENRPARAPYNFIPIKDKAVIGGNPFLKNKYNETLYTGYIDLEIKTLTPVYIRDGLPLNEYNNDNKNNTDFFNINGKYLIPGSSLKGMIRTLVEIVTFSKFKFYDDKRFYYRMVGARTALQIARQYREKLLGGHRQEKGDRRITNVKPGFIYKEGKDYYLIPAKETNYVLNRGPNRHNCQEPGFMHEGNTYYVCSGRMFHKYHHYSFTLPDNPQERKISLSDEDINDYKNDITRNSKLDLLKSLKKHKFVPCFYIKHNGKRYALGHNPFFRLPYDHTIAPFIPSARVTDISEAMFGIENDKGNTGASGKVFFESSVLEGNPQFAINQPAYPDVLSSPKPTSFQLYLEQHSNSLRDLVSYNDSGVIRGYKMYWHKKNPNWQFSGDVNKSRKILPTPIKPLSENNVFKGKIRFENLHSYELGALLFILDLPKGMAHKIGLGKPLGLGSIRITPTLHLSNRKNRYSDLWTEFTSVSESDKTEFIDKFKNIILQQLQQLKINVADIWQQERFVQLKKMLTFEQNTQIQNWLDKTSYMELGEFRARAVLPKPTNVR